MHGNQKPGWADRPDAFWNRVYIAVVAVTFLVITSLWAFSKYFSS